MSASENTNKIMLFSLYITKRYSFTSTLILCAYFFEELKAVDHLTFSNTDYCCNPWFCLCKLGDVLWQQYFNFQLRFTFQPLFPECYLRKLLTKYIFLLSLSNMFTEIRTNHKSFWKNYVHPCVSKSKLKILYSLALKLKEKEKEITLIKNVYISS